MQYRKVGRSGLRVSEISLGSWLTYGNVVERDVARRTIETAYDLGINFFDTANVYARGEAEKVVGEVLRQYPRTSYVLATKVFGEMGDGPNDRGLSRKHVLEQAEASLRRLGTEYIDIYYCHRFDPNTPIEETLRAFDDLIRQGKVLYMGVSEWSAVQIAQALHIADAKLLSRIIVNQPIYNILNRYIEEEIIPLGSERGFGQVVFSPLAQGILTGKYRRGEQPPEGTRAADPKVRGALARILTDERLAQVDRLADVARELDIPLARLALAFVLARSNVASALIGASRPEQVVENVTAVGVALSEETLAKIDEIAPRR